jgi:hypothetical protein
MNLSDDVFGLLAKALGQMHKTARPSRQGKHRAGRRNSPNGHHALQAARKRQRDARRYARMCANGQKHRAGRRA